MHYIVSAPPRRFSSHSVLSVVNVEFLSWHMSKNKKPWALTGSSGGEADNGCRGSSSRFGSRSDADLRQTIQLTKCKMNSYSPKSQTGGGLDSKCHLLYQDSNIY